MRLDCLVSTLLPLWVPYVTCYATHLFFPASIFTLDLVMEVSIFACPTIRTFTAAACVLMKPPFPVCLRRGRLSETRVQHRFVCRIDYEHTE